MTADNLSRREIPLDPEYSPRLGRLSPAQFQAALDHFGLGRFIRAAPISAGLFGQNVFVTSTVGEFVLRGCPHYDWQFPAERFYARLLHECTRVPVPWPYLINPTGEVFGWSYALMPRMPGMQLSDEQAVAALAGKDRRAIARALGETLATMQELTWPEAGVYNLAADTVQPFLGTHRERVEATVERCLAHARNHADRTTEADIAWARELVASAASALDQPFVPSFVLGDYKEQNATAERWESGWRISGVFDLMEGQFADGEADLCRQVALYLERAPVLASEFVRAYCARRPPRPGFATRLPVYMLYDRLIVWDYYQRPGHTPYWNPSLTLREWAGPFIAASRQLADN